MGCVGCTCEGGYPLEMRWIRALGIPAERNKMARRVGECPVPFVFATCLKTSPSCYPCLLLFPCACVFTKRKRTRAEGMPDLLIARHSCPFVRHLIASRGSRGILRGVYLCPLPLSFFLSLSLSISLLSMQLHGARLGIRYTFRGRRCLLICPLYNLASAYLLTPLANYVWPHTTLLP